MAPGKVICISGIDTDIGKSIATGLLGRYLLGLGRSVTTQKICQTGCVGISEDLCTHRRLMDLDLQPEDREGLTCPYIFKEPCSPHLAARLEGKTMDLRRITAATDELRRRYDYVLLEGVGGLMVPLQQDVLLADYLSEHDYTHVLVSCSRLGSINHTLAAMEILARRKMEIAGIIYNRFMDTNEAIAEDTRRCIAHFMRTWGMDGAIVDMPPTEDVAAIQVDFSGFFPPE